MKVCVRLGHLCSIQCLNRFLRLSLSLHIIANILLYNVANAKEALELAKLQEQTEQLKHQEEIRVTVYNRGLKTTTCSIVGVFTSS